MPGNLVDRTMNRDLVEFLLIGMLMLVVVMALCGLMAGARGLT